MRKYSLGQIVGFILALFLPPVAVWFTEGFGIDFWLNCLLTILGYIPGSIHAVYIWIFWIQRKWTTKNGGQVTLHPLLIFSKEFEVRSRWKGNGQDGFFGRTVSSVNLGSCANVGKGYFDDNIKGGSGKEVGGDVDPEKAVPPTSS
jgi:uncharacterized membrane protein YqaE (UPF0057 family)